MEMQDFKKKQDKSQKDETEGSEPAVDYAEWFTGKLKDNQKLRAHHYAAILAFYKANGLNEQESKSEYDSMLTKFGF